MYSLLRNYISHETFQTKSPHYYNGTEYNVVAPNVGPLFFSLVPSLNDDVCEPFALKKYDSLMWLLFL